MLTAPTRAVLQAVGCAVIGFAHFLAEDGKLVIGFLDGMLEKVIGIVVSHGRPSLPFWRQRPRMEPLVCGGFWARNGARCAFQLSLFLAHGVSGSDKPN